MSDDRYSQHDDFCRWHDDQDDAACRCSASRSRRVGAASEAAYGEPVTAGLLSTGMTVPVHRTPRSYDPVAASNAVDYFAEPPVLPIKQSRADSFCEALTNTAIGYLVTLIASPLIYHALGVRMSFAQVNGAVLLFTVVSVARQYVLRRLFDGRSPWRALRARLG